MITIDRTGQPLRAVIYTRVSTDRQAEKGTSLESQLEACQKKARELGAEVVDHFSDAGVDGDFYKHRPELQAALKLLETGKADVFVCLSIDRLSRKNAVLSTIADRIKRAGAGLEFCNMTFDNSHVGRLQRSILGAFAEFDKEGIAKRVADGREARARAGTQTQRSRSPYGYKIVDRPSVMAHQYTEDLLGSYQVVESEARVVRQIFGLYLSGQSLRSVAFQLQHEGIPTPKGGACWGIQTVRGILLHPAYKGEAHFGKMKRIRDEELLTSGQKNPWTHIANDPSKVITIPCPIIIPPAEWEATQKRLGEARALYSGRSDRKHMLTGLLQCPKCSKGMRGQFGRDLLNYRCRFSRPSRRSDHVVCNRDGYSGATVEALVVKGIVEAIKRPELVKAAVAAWQRKQEENFDQGEYDRLKIELGDLEGKLKAAAVAQVQAIQDGSDASLFRALVVEGSQRKRDIQKQLGAMDAQREEDRVDPAAVSRMVESTLRDVAVALQSPAVSAVDKHDMLAQVVTSIRPEGEGLVTTLVPVHPAGYTVQCVSIPLRPFTCSLS